MRWLFYSILPVAFLLGSGGGLLHADSVVNLCSSANQAGPGINLDTAIRAGGRVTFSCPAASVLSLDQTFEIKVPTTVEGNGNITLNSLPADVAFVMKGPPLHLNGVSFRCSAASPSIGVVGGSGGDVSFERVTFKECPAAVNLARSALSFTKAAFQNSGLGRLDVDPQPPPRGVDPIRPREVTVTVNGLEASGVPSGGSQFMYLRAKTISISNLQIKQGGQSALAFDTLTLAGSSISGATTDPRAKDPPGAGVDGGALNLTCINAATGCHAGIANSEFSDNHVPGAGGAIRMAGVDAVISDTTFTSNNSGGDGGALSFSGNNVAGLRLSRTIFRKNSAQNGGALAFDSMPTNAPANAVAAAFQSNSASLSGGAIVGASRLLLTRGYVIDNHAGTFGGGLSVSNSLPSQISNTVIAGNNAKSGGGGLQGNYDLINSTMLGNSGGSFTGNLALSNSIVANNTPSNCSASVVDNGHNLQTPGNSCSQTITSGSPGLDHLFAPSPLGPAAGSGDIRTCGSAPVDDVDVYGSPRGPSKCSIGAVETNPFNSVLQNAPGQAGLLFPKVIGLSMMLYAVAGGFLFFLALFGAKFEAAARQSFLYAFLSSALLFVITVIWLIVRFSSKVTWLDWGLYLYIPLFLYGWWSIARTIRNGTEDIGTVPRGQV